MTDCASIYGVCDGCGEPVAVLQSRGLDLFGLCEACSAVLKASKVPEFAGLYSDESATEWDPSDPFGPGRATYAKYHP